MLVLAGAALPGPGVRAAMVSAELEVWLTPGFDSAAPVVADAPLRSTAGALDPDGVPSPSEVDLLLELQVEREDLGPTPIDAADSVAPGSPMDLRSLTPDLPFNPAFPGQGLSFEAPTAVARELAPSFARPQTDRSEPAPLERWRAATVSALGLDQRDAHGRSRVHLWRDWLAAHRLELLAALVLATVFTAGGIALGRRLGAAASPPPPARRRRRRSGHSRHGHHR